MPVRRREEHRRAPNGVLDFSLKSSRLDEFEHAANSMLLTARLTPPGGHKRSDSKLFFHGSKDLGLLKIQYGCALTADLVPEDNDDRVAFGLSLNGRNNIRWRGEEVTISPRNRGRHHMRFPQIHPV